MCVPLQLMLPRAGSGGAAGAAQQAAGAAGGGGGGAAAGGGGAAGAAAAAGGPAAASGAGGAAGPAGAAGAAAAGEAPAAGRHQVEEDELGKWPGSLPTSVVGDRAQFNGMVSAGYRRPAGAVLTAVVRLVSISMEDPCPLASDTLHYITMCTFGLRSNWAWRCRLGRCLSPCGGLWRWAIGKCSSSVSGSRRLGAARQSRR